MKSLKIATLVLVSLLGLSANAQTEIAASSDGAVQSLFNVQAGAVGIFGSYEAALSTRWALRTEVGLDLYSYESLRYNGTSLQEDKGSFLIPVISVEPRWYYNIEKRSKKGKHTGNNSANFLTLAVKFHPDIFQIGGPEYLDLPNQLSFIPKWGMRRAISRSNFNYEIGAGIGILTYLTDGNFTSETNDAAIDLHIRIGYTF